MAPNEIQKILSTNWRTSPSGPFFDQTPPPPEFLKMVPPDYLASIAEFGGREGFLGKEYLRLYRLQELVAINIAYEVPTYFPEIIIFASDGFGEAFAFVLGTTAVVQVSLIPLMADSAIPRGSTFTEFIQSTASTGPSPAHNANAVGMEVHLKHPLCLGGSPTDTANRVLVPANKHAELCRFLNKVYHNALKNQSK